MKKHVTTNKTNNNVNYILSIREVRNDHVTCTRCCDSANEVIENFVNTYLIVDETNF